MNILVPSKDYPIASDKRLLIPFSQSGHIGFLTKQGCEIVPARYDEYRGDCYSKTDLVAIGQHYIHYYGEEEKSKPYIYTHWGVINSDGQEIIPLSYKELYISDDGFRIVVKNENNKWGVIDPGEEMIVPFGKYSKIHSFLRGYARVIINHENGKSQYGLIDEMGNEVVPPIIDKIWSLNENYDSVVLEINGKRELLSYVVLDKISAEICTNGVAHTSYKDALEYVQGMQQQFGLIAEDIDLAEIYKQVDETVDREKNLKNDFIYSTCYK